MIAFVLSGGGALGAFEVGVMRQLATKGIIPDILYGTSTGALNSAGYAYRGLGYLESMWLNIKGFNDIFKSRGILTPLYLLFGDGKGVFSTSPLESKLKDVVKGRAGIKACVCQVSLKTTAADYVYTPDQQMSVLTDSKVLADANYKFSRAVLASASTPIFNDVVDGEYVDGGIRHIAPVGKAIKDGADEIYVILAERFQENQAPNFKGKIGNTLNVAKYTINTFVQSILWSDVKICQKINKLIDSTKSKSLKDVRKINIHVYAPTMDIGDAADFSPAHISEIMKLGQVAEPII